MFLADGRSEICFAICYLILSFKLMQDNNFPVLTEHMRDNGPQQASMACLLPLGFSWIGSFLPTRFESLHPGKCVGKQVSPLGNVGRGPVGCSRCKPARRFRNCSLLPVTRRDTWGPKTGAKTYPCHPLLSKNWDDCDWRKAFSLKLVRLEGEKELNRVQGQGLNLAVSSCLWVSR